MSFLNGVYHDEMNIDVKVFLRVYMDKRVISGLDLRGQSQEITQSGYLNIQWNGENLTLCISLAYCDPVLSYLLKMFVHFF